MESRRKKERAMKNNVNVIAVLDLKGEKLLVCRRRKDPYQGLLNLTGGKINPGEDGLCAAYRELYEETGITDQDIALTHLMDFIYYMEDIKLEVYFGRLNKELEVQGEENELLWVSRDQNFFDQSIFAGEGNIGHIMERIKKKEGKAMEKKRYAVITGASAGIGMEFAKRLAKKGFPLVLIARRRERLEKLAGELKTKCEIIEADLSKEEECYRVFYELKEKKIGIFINNAGFGDCGRFEETDLSKEMNMVQLNVKALHILMKLMLKKMQKEGYGYILNVASSAGLMPAGPYMATYYATKSYVTSLTQAVAQELKESRSPIYVGCLCPGPVDTEFNSVANVEFALKGISAGYCAAYALKQMARRQVVIIPTRLMQAAMLAGRFLPVPLYVRIAAHQQRKKLYEKK